MKSSCRRTATGQASVPIILLAILVVGVIGIFAFEIARAAMIRDQLRTATESAALGGAAALAGASQIDPLDSQTKAISAAKSVFIRNEIFGVPLDNVEEDFDNAPKLGHAKIRMQYLDPKNHNAVVPLGDPKAKLLQVETKFGFSPVFPALMGMTSSVNSVTANAQGGVGDLDIVLCFDISGSMDDETQMTRVMRRWDPAQGKIVYDVVAQGKLAQFAGAVPPQQLDGTGLNTQLRGTQNTGAPPGNFPPGNAALGGYTDAVVNLNDQPSFTPMTVDGFTFPDVATLVEAARGNLESAAVFHSSQANTALSGTVAPRAGYQAKYLQTAKKHIHPLGDAQQAATDFFTLMNKNSNAHFGLVAFDDHVGTDSLSKITQPNVAASYPAGGNGDFPLPNIKLQKPEDTTNFNEVIGAIEPMVAIGGTNIGGAADAAINMFDTNSRPNAKKVVIMFTDGVPNVGGPLSGSPATNCQLAAQKAQRKGIALYTVGLCLTPSLLVTQEQVLSDKLPGGMAKIAGNGSKFFQVRNATNLRGAFANIARQLSSLVD